MGRNEEVVLCKSMTDRLVRIGQSSLSPSCMARRDSHNHHWKPLFLCKCIARTSSECPQHEKRKMSRPSCSLFLAQPQQVSWPAQWLTRVVQRASVSEKSTVASLQTEEPMRHDSENEDNFNNLAVCVVSKSCRTLRGHGTNYE